MKSFLIVLAFLFIHSSLFSQFTNGQPAVGVLGQPDFVSSSSGLSSTQLNGPNGVAVDPVTGKVFVLDRGNHRILRWSSADALSNGSAAEAVFGQTDFATNTSGTAADKFSTPIGVYIDFDGRMWVGDYGNNRVLRFDNASNLSSGASADGVLGQADFTSGSSAVTQSGMSGPVGIYADTSGTLWVSNFGSHRVLRFDDAANKANGANADGVLGQSDFTSNSSGLGQNSMNGPNSVYVDWLGNLWVSDYANRRVLRFDDAANKPDGVNADGVLGQPDFTSNASNTTQNGSGSMRFVNGDPWGRLYSVQESAHRLMIYNNAASLANGANADFVIGQSDFTTSSNPSPPTAASLNVPRSIFVDYNTGHVWLTDWANNRVLRYDAVFDTMKNIELISPNGGEVWITDSQQNITWYSMDVNSVNIEFSADSGSTWTTIEDSVDAAPQSYLWTVHNNITTNALIRISDTDSASISDTSNATFTISVPFSNIELVSPNGYQQWETGAQKHILYNQTNVDTVTLEYSSDAGQSWNLIENAAATGSYTWTVSATLSDHYLIRILNKQEPVVCDTSNNTFSVVAEKVGGEQDFTFFYDSPTPVFYDPSWGYANAPSTLELVGNKFPVTTDYSLVGNYSLKLNWSSNASGDWGIAVAGIGWVGRDVTTKDTLEMHIFSESTVDSVGLPEIYLEDLSNQKTDHLPMWDFISEIMADSWQKITIPLQVFIDNPGNADLTRIKTIFFGQNEADATQHTVYIDDIQMTGGQIISGDSTTVIVVLGSSTAAGTGPSSPDSAWVNRFRKAVQEEDSTAYVVNLAVGGYTTYNIMPTDYTPPAGRPSPMPNNNITYALTYKPTAIIINLPSNDAAQNIPVYEQLANYNTVLAHASTLNVPVWITTTQPRNFSSQAQRDSLIAMRDSTYARFGNKAIDFWTDIANPDGTINPTYNSGDGVHINDAGHRIFFQRVMNSGVWDLVSYIGFNDSQIPDLFKLNQNYPNPFNPVTTISYSLPEKALVKVKLYDILGREVVSIINEEQNSGFYTLKWDATQFSSGVYFYRITAQSGNRIKFQQAKKMVVMK